MEKIDSNQIRTIGANIKATLWVPQCCRAKRPINMTQASSKSSPRTTNRNFQKTMPMHGPGEVNYISIAIRNMQRFETNNLLSVNLSSVTCKPDTAESTAIEKKKKKHKPKIFFNPSENIIKIQNSITSQNK